MIMQENLTDRGHYKCKGPGVDHPWSTWKAWLEHREHGTDESKMRSAGVGGLDFILCVTGGQGPKNASYGALEYEW